MKRLTAWKVREVPGLFLVLVGCLVCFVFFHAINNKTAEAEVDTVLNSILTLALTIPAIVLPIPLTGKNDAQAKKSLQNILYWVLGFCTLAVIKFLTDILKVTGYLGNIASTISVLLAAATIICYLFILMFSLGYIHKYLSDKLNS